MSSSGVRNLGLALLLGGALLAGWWLLGSGGASEVPGTESSATGSSATASSATGAGSSIGQSGSPMAAGSSRAAAAATSSGVVAPDAGSSAATASTGRGGLLFCVVDHELRGQAGYSITLGDSEDSLGETGASGEVRITPPERMVADAVFWAKRGEDTVRFYPDGDRRYRAHTVPKDAVVVLVVRADTGAPIEDVSVGLSLATHPPASEIAGTEQWNSAFASAGPDGDDDDGPRGSTDVAGRAVFRSLPAERFVWVSVSDYYYHSTDSGKYYRPGSTIRIALAPIRHALVVGEGAEITRLQLADERPYWQCWRPECDGQRGTADELWREHRESIPIVFEERWNGANKDEEVATAYVGWRDRKGLEKHQVPLRPIVDGAHLVRLRPRAAVDPEANAEMRIKVVDLSGVPMDPVEVQVWRSIANFADKGLVSGPMIVPAGRYNVAVADSRLRRWAKPITVEAVGGKVQEVELKFERPMIRVRPDIVSGPDDEEFYQLRISDSRGDRVFADGATYQGEGAEHWVPADLLTVKVVLSTFMRQLLREPGSGRAPTTRKTWVRTFDLRTVRRDKVIPLAVDVSGPPDSTK